MLMPDTVALALLPALSTAVPVTDWLAPSVLSVWSAVTLAMPEVASLAVKCTVTALLYQPAALGDVVAAPLIVGGVASRLIVTLSVEVPPALVAEKLTMVPVVSKS